jgi:hypothetical protein
LDAVVFASKSQRYSHPKSYYYNQKESRFFQTRTPPLIPIAGAPKPSYSLFMELGDGHYSKEAEPKHTYKKKEPILPD